MEVLTLEGLADPAVARGAEVLENGGLLLWPALPFPLTDGETALLDPAILARGIKNVSLDPDGMRVGGTVLEGARLETLRAMMARYARHADAVLAAAAPTYGPALQRRRTSFRPAPVDTRVLSPRKDDRRLHVDAFPANPVQGRRILRVFTNVHPAGGERAWEVGEDGFAAFASDRLGGVRRARAAGGWRERLGLTKGRRTAYDAAMLALHDAAKLDDAWQASTPKRALSFPAGSTWVVFTDAVLHAALAGQHALEQTYLLPVEAMARPELSPLRVLERQVGRALA